MKIKRNKEGKIVYDTSTPIDEQIASLSKIANRQLTMLEKLSKEPGFAGVTAIGSTAYSAARRDIIRINRAIGSKRNARFANKITPDSVKVAVNTNENLAPETKKRIMSNFNEYVLQRKEQELAALIRFLNSPTYSKKRIEAMFIEAVNKINKDYGTNFTWLEWHKFVEDARFEAVKKAYHSDKMLELVASFQKGKKELVKAVYGSMKQSGINSHSRSSKLTNDEIIELLYANKANNKKPTVGKVEELLETLNKK